MSYAGGVDELDKAQRNARLLDRYGRFVSFGAGAVACLGYYLTVLRVVFGDGAFWRGPAFAMVFVFFVVWLLASLGVAFAASHYDAKAKRLSRPEDLPRATVVRSDQQA